MQTPGITLWFPKLGFFIFEKHLASQNMILVQSVVEVRLIPMYNSHAIRTFFITAYLFLALYVSTTLQSRLFLKNIEKLLCKKKIVNNSSIPSIHTKKKNYLQAYRYNCFSKISKTFCASRK